MTEIEEAPAEAAARTAAPRDKGEDQPAPSMLRGATSALLRKVFRRASAETLHTAGRRPASLPEDSRTSPGLKPEEPGTGSERSPSHAHSRQTADDSWLEADGGSESSGSEEGQPVPGVRRRARSGGPASAVPVGGAGADGGGRDAGRASGTVADGHGEPDADRADAAGNGPGAGSAASEPGAPDGRQDAAGAARRGCSRSGIEAERGARRPDKAAPETRNLGDRLPSLGAGGWTGRDAEWLALVCLHGGVFLRPQYLAFLGRSHPELARRFVRRCGRAAVEERWNAAGLKLCRIVDRALYRELGVQHLRPRRDATPAVALRRLLALDYVIDHLDAPWLPADGEKVAAFTAAGAPKDLWPGRVYVGADGARHRPFVHRLPITLDAERATFVFVQPEEETQGALRTWGGKHAGLWATLLAVGRAVEVVVVGRNTALLAAAGQVLDGWVSAPGAADARCEAVAAEHAEQARRSAEFAMLRKAVATLDDVVLAAYGGLNGVVARCAALETEARTPCRAKPMITVGRTWRSVRVPE